MAGIDLQVRGGQELADKLKRLGASLPEKLTNSMQTQMVRLADFVRVNKLSGQVLNRRSGALSRSVFGQASSSGTQIKGTIGSAGVKYARIWELTGSAAHTVVPVNAKALRFEIGGEVLFRMRANIPAQNPRPFLRPSMDENREKILAALRKTVAETLRAT